MYRLVLILLLIASYAPAEMKDPVVCKADPKQSYALFVPSNYSTNKTWPILYCYDARGHGKLFGEIFTQAAEKYGWIVASSNNTRSDDLTWPNFEAIKALWNDTHMQLAINDKRVYVAGFSGCSRIAWNVGYAYPKIVAGVIGCSGGNHESHPPAKDVPFVYFSTAGTRDFNYPEMVDLNAKLEKLGLPHVLAFFDGDHDWPPPELATQAIEWMEVRAMKSGLRDKDNQILNELYDKRMKAAATKQACDAEIDYRTISDDFSGMIDTSPVAAKLKTLEHSDDVKKEKKLRDHIQDEAKQYLMDLLATLKDFEATNGAMPAMADLQKRMRIHELLDRVKKQGDSEEGLAAQRMLEAAFVHLSFYLPMDFIERKDSARGFLALNLAEEIHNDSPRVWMYRTRLYALSGDKTKAVECLQKAVVLGFSDPKILENDPNLASLHNEPRYQAIVTKLTN